MPPFKDMNEFVITPVGVVHSSLVTPAFRPDQGDHSHEKRLKDHRKQHKERKNLISTLEIDPALDGILDGIEDYSHILVLYWPHLIPGDRRALCQVHPMGRKDMPIKGVYATCSPARPNPVLVSAVPLLERKGNILKVRGLDAVDGSPIVDIKPYVLGYPEYPKVTVPDWIEKLQEDLEKEDT